MKHLQYERRWIWQVTRGMAGNDAPRFDESFQAEGRQLSEERDRTGAKKRGNTRS